MGEEAHIKGEKPSAPRYDPAQSPVERESYANRILLCPTHHTEIDSDPATWTVARLQQMKTDHENQVRLNWNLPELLDDMRQLLQRYEALPLDESGDVQPSAVIGGTDRATIRIDATCEGGVNTQIRVQKGQRILLFARGLVTYDGGQNYALPEGVICNELGLPYLLQDPSGNTGLAMWLHPDAYKTDGGISGRIGSLIGWIRAYSEEKSFFVGSKRVVEASEDGDLFLMVNDAKGTYDDNNGEFRVDISLPS